MAPIVGVPKREPCKQCGLPVFFAERLAVDGSFYHRKCLRCARCDSQLTPGSFYETEVDGVFCCETCPDEEKKLQRLGTNNNNNSSSTGHDDGNDVDDDSSANRNSKNTSATANGIVEQQQQSPEHRQSFSEKLAMFQTNGSGSLLQKSLSDEEKSKSLKRLTEFYSKNAQPPTTIDEIVEKQNVQASETTAAATNSDSSDDDDEDDEEDNENENEVDEQPPELPSTAPPNAIETKPSHTDETQSESPQMNKPKLPPIPSKANVLNKIYAQMNANGGGGESPIKLATAKRPRSISQTSVELLPPPSIAANDIQSSLEQLQKRRDSHNNDEHDSSNNVLSTPTKYIQSQNNNRNDAAAAMTTANSSNKNEDNTSTTIGNSLNTKGNHLPLDALDSSTNVTKENDAAGATAAEQVGESQRDAVNAHRLNADDDNIIINDMNCDGMTTHISANANSDSHTIESGASVDGKSAYGQQSDPEHTLQTANDDRQPILDTNQDIDGNNASSKTHQTAHSLDKCVDDTNEIDDITLRREQQPQQQQKTSSVRDNDRQNVVRSRLSQFEALLQSNSSPHNSPRLQRRTDDVDHASKQRKKSIDTGVVVEDKLHTQSNTTISSRSSSNSADDAVEKETKRESNAMNAIVPEIAINQVSLNDNDVNDLQQQSAASDEIAPNACSDENSNAKNKPIPRQRATLNASSSCLDNTDDDAGDKNPPTPCKRKHKTPSNDAQQQQQQQQIPTDSEKKNESAAVECMQKQNEAKYPNDLNPFGSDDEQDEEANGVAGLATNPKTMDNSNPFDSSDDEIELLKDTPSPPRVSLSNKATPSKNYRISTNPFGSDSENDEPDDTTDTDSLSSKRTPVPTPRKQINGSMLQTSTPDISAHRHTLHPKMRLHADSSFHGSDASLASPSKYIGNHRPMSSSTLNRSSHFHGSLSSLASSSTSTTPRRKKGRAPDIPPTPRSSSNSGKPTTTTTMSANSSPSQSMRATPTIARKKRQAPLPPSLSPAPTPHRQPTENRPKCELSALPSIHCPNDSTQKPCDASLSSQHTASSESVVDLENSLNLVASTESNYVSSSNDLSLSSTEPHSFLDAQPQQKQKQHSPLISANGDGEPKCSETSAVQRKVIHVDQSLLDDVMRKSIGEMPADENITYRRKIIPDQMCSPATVTPSSLQKLIAESTQLTDRQCEKMKENKESQNKNRQSQNGSLTTIASVNAAAAVVDELNQVFSPNKSSFGKWKRRKGPAPSLPVPPRKVIQMLPLQEIRHELEVIEVQQQGLEKQGVMLEKMIRERCEGAAADQPLSECKPNTKEVEDLILQLFELVNEKNELFRRQAELMYLRRQHRLEQEQADIEYEIRVLMAQPECNKTDSDKAREEALISRLVEVVQLRNEVIESLEMDRRREAEEDQSIKERLELHTAKREEELCQPQTPIKLSKKEKKKQKESKKLAKQKKMDADKDADESELSLSEKSKEKKKKKKFLFLHS